MLILGGGGLSGGNEHVWLFTRRVLLPLESSSALESTSFVMLLVACKASEEQGVLIVVARTRAS